MDGSLPHAPGCPCGYCQHGVAGRPAIGAVGRLFWRRKLMRSALFKRFCVLEARAQRRGLTWKERHELKRLSSWAAFVRYALPAIAGSKCSTCGLDRYFHVGTHPEGPDDHEFTP